MNGNLTMTQETQENSSNANELLRFTGMYKIAYQTAIQKRDKVLNVWFEVNRDGGKIRISTVDASTMMQARGIKVRTITEEEYARAPARNSYSEFCWAASLIPEILEY